MKVDANLTLTLASFLLGLAQFAYSIFIESSSNNKSKIRKRPLNRRISSPPGWNLLRLADFCFSKKTFTQVLEPTLGDMQKEHIDALAEGRPWKARMALVRGYVSFWSAVAAQAPLSILSLLCKIWKTTKIGS